MRESTAIEHRERDWDADHFTVVSTP